MMPLLYLALYCVFFFFSSRRRHTRLVSDWSSDVCSSDLGGIQIMRWLSIGGSAQEGPAVFYDPDAPFQGDRRSSGFRLGLQPNSRLSSNTSYSFVTFTNRSTGLNVYHVHIVNLRNTYQFSPRFFVRGIAQYDSSRDRIRTDFLASYELSPGP